MTDGGDVHGGDPGRRGDRAASSVEYSLLIAGVAGVLVVALMTMGGHLSGILDCLSGQLAGGAPAASCPGGGGPAPTGEPWPDPPAESPAGPPAEPSGPGTTSGPTTGPTTTGPTPTGSATTTGPTSSTTTSSTTTSSTTTSSTTSGPTPAG